MNYFNTPYEPLNTLVNCGNGQLSMAYGCYGFSGVCFASCYYPGPGVYYPSAYAGGAYCAGTSVSVAGYGGGGGSGGGGGNGGGTIPTPIPAVSPSCSVSTNPYYLVTNGSATVTIAYNDFQGTPQGNIACGNGISVAAACSGSGQGSCTATCTYQKPSRFPTDYIISSALNGITCSPGGMLIVDSSNPGYLSVTVVNQSFAPIPGAGVEVGGQLQQTNLTGETVFSLNAGSYTLRATKDGYNTAMTNVRIASDQTTRATLQLTRNHGTFCKVAASPSIVRGGSSSAVTVSYFDVSAAPSSVQVNCGNGQTSSAACSGTVSQGSCIATCAYAADGVYPSNFVVDASVEGQKCSTGSVQVVQPLSGTGTLSARVSACSGGNLLANAQLRVSSPSATIPTNFSGDGIRSVVPVQTVRADNGFIVRLDSVQQQPSASTTPLTFSTGDQNFPTNATDTSTVGQSFVRVNSTIAPNAFRFGSENTNSIFLVTDSVSAGKSTQGLVFYQSPTTSFYVPYIHPNAEGSVAYAAGKAINLSAASGVAISNSTNLTGCNSYTSPTSIGSFAGYQLLQPVTFNGGTPTASGYTLRGFSGSALVSASSVNASCTSGNFTITFQNAAGQVTPGLGDGQYSLTYNYVDFNYGQPATMQFYAPAISIGATDPNAGNGYAIAIPEYLTSSNTQQGAWMVDVGYGDQPNPRLLSANGPAVIGYNASFTAKAINADSRPSGFLSPRGSSATISLTSATINYGLDLSTPAATVSFLNPQGGLLKQDMLRVNEAAATADVLARVLGISGNSTSLEVRSLTSYPNASTIYYTNDFGEAFVQLSPGTYNVEYFKDGYNSSRSTVVIDAARSTTQSACLEPLSCDFAVEMVSAPTCQHLSDAYQFRITNPSNATKNVTLSYSSSEIDGPMIAILQPQQSTIVTLRAKAASSAISGRSLGIVNMAGPDSCTKSYTLPLCTASGIVLEAPNPRLNTVPGKAVCTSLLVKNHALETAKVVLSASSATTALGTSFAPSEFTLTPLEVKNVDFCATPHGGFSGSATVSVHADSPFGQANGTIVVDAAGQTFFSTDFSGCPIVDASRTTNYALSVQNNGQAGDYVLKLDDNALSVRDEFVLQQFQHGETRPVMVQLEPFGAKAGRSYFNAFLQQDGRTVYQQQLCFEVRGTSVAKAELSTNPVDVPRGQSTSAFMTIRNLGSLKAEYTVQPDSSVISIKPTPSVFNLKPNEEQIVELLISAGQTIESRSYVIPLKVFARTALDTATEQYSVDLQCGDGKTATMTCPAGTGSCTTTCAYSNTGTYTPSATISGRTCSTSSSNVRVLDTNANTCMLQASPNNGDKGATMTVVANYYGLSAPFNGTLAINCGNGQVVTAQNCNGNTGACSATCSYASEGSYVVTASQNSTACQSALVAVGNPSATSCQITANQNTILKGESTSIQLRYYNLPSSGTSTTLTIPFFVGAENLLVNVLSGSETVSLSSAELLLGTVPPQQVFSGTSLRIPVKVKNENYFAVNNVLLYFDKVPQGFVVTAPQRFSLQPGQEKAVEVVVEATAAVEPSTAVFTLVAESPNTAPATQKVFVTVLSSPSQQLNIDVTATVQLKADGGSQRYIVDAIIVNREPVALALTPSFVLGENWASFFTPKSASLLPNGQASVQGQISPVALDPSRTYNATLRIRSSDGRVKDVPMELNSNGGRILTGYVTLGDLFSGGLLSGGNMLPYFVAFLLLLAVAGFFYAAKHSHGVRGG